jgi:hypothetical protein
MCKLSKLGGMRFACQWLTECVGALILTVRVFPYRSPTPATTMHTLLQIQIHTSGKLLGTLLCCIETLILAILPATLSICAVNTGMCDDKKSVPNIVLILADDKYKNDLTICVVSSDYPSIMPISY